MKNFDPNVPVFVNKEITVCGKAYSAGDGLDWFQLGLPERRVRQLFEQRKIAHLPQFIQPKIKTVSKVKTRQPKIENNDIIGDYKIVEKSRFWYDVLDKEGNKINTKSLRRDDAILYAEAQTEKKRQALEAKLKAEKSGE